MKNEVIILGVLGGKMLIKSRGCRKYSYIKGWTFPVEAYMVTALASAAYIEDIPTTSAGVQEVSDSAQRLARSKVSMQLRR